MVVEDIFFNNKETILFNLFQIHTSSKIFFRILRVIIVKNCISLLITIDTRNSPTWEATQKIQPIMNLKIS